jgi:prephenate dehydratase
VSRRAASRVRARRGGRIISLDPDAPQAPDQVRRVEPDSGLPLTRRRFGVRISKEAVMATTVRRTAYFSMKTPNRPGQGARLLSGLAAHGVNLLAFTGFPNAGRAQVDFIPYDANKFTRAARKLGMKVSKKKTVFLAQGSDKAGAVASICGKLAKAGINMVAMDAVAAGGKRYGAMFWVRPRDVARAARVLRAR